MLSTVSIVEKLVLRKEFTCSDGFVTYNGFEANKHEMLLKIEQIFSDVATKDGRKGHTKRYYFTRKFSLDCGVYRVAIKDRDDLEALDYYFTGLTLKLGNPKEFPLEFNLDIYYEKIPGVLRDQAQWRIYCKKDYQ